LDLPGFPRFRKNIAGITKPGPGLGRLITEGAIFATERNAEGLMAILAHHLTFRVTAQAFGGAVKVNNLPIQVMADNGLRQMVQDVFQVLSGGGQLFQGVDHSEI